MFFVVGAISQYLGAALAVALFDDLPATAVGWLRVSWSAAVLWAWRRPSWRTWSSVRRRSVVSFGVALGAMNVCFYLAIERLPLGTAVAIEFSGPIAVAALGVRTGRNVLALAVALVGVVLLADVQWEASPLGVVFALAAATMWAGYIVLGARIGGAAGDGAGAAGDGAGAGAAIDGLAASSVVGALLIAPLGLVGVASDARSTSGGVLAGAVLLCAVVGVLSNVVPYALDQFVFRRIAPSQFALLSTLLPATAAVTGALLLAQIPTPVEALGVALVIVAVGIRERG